MTERHKPYDTGAEMLPVLSERTNEQLERFERLMDLIGSPINHLGCVIVPAEDAGKEAQVIEAIGEIWKQRFPGAMVHLMYPEDFPDTTNYVALEHTDEFRDITAYAQDLAYTEDTRRAYNERANQRMRSHMRELCIARGNPQDLVILDLPAADAASAAPYVDPRKAPFNGCDIQVLTPDRGSSPDAIPVMLVIREGAVRTLIDKWPGNELHYSIGHGGLVGSLGLPYEWQQEDVETTD